MDNWNHFQIIDKQHTWKPLGTTSKENSYTGHCAHILKCSNVIVQNINHGKQHYNHTL